MPPVDAPITSTWITSSDIARSGACRIRPTGATGAGLLSSAKPRAFRREKDFREAPIETSRAGLGKRIGSPEGQGRHGLLGTFLGHRRHDHDACAPHALSRIREFRAQAACAGHFEIEQDRIDTNGLERVDCVFRGARNGGELERIVAFDHPRQHCASDDAVVDDHQADPAFVYRRDRLAVPRTGERPLHGPQFSGYADELKLDVQRLSIERFHYIFVRTGFERGTDVRHVVLGGAEDDLGLVFMAPLPKHTQELHSAHHGHVPVEQDNVRHLGFAPRQRLASVAGLIDLEVESLENMPRDLANDLRVIDDQTTLHALLLPTRLVGVL